MEIASHERYAVCNDALALHLNQMAKPLNPTQSCVSPQNNSGETDELFSAGVNFRKKFFRTFFDLLFV